MTRQQLEELVQDLPQALQAGLCSWAIDNNRLYLDIKKETLPDFAHHLHRKHQVWLVSEHASDERTRNGTYRLHIIFSLPRSDAYVILRVKIDQTDRSYPSITSEVYAAARLEREVRDMFGLVPLGHPDIRSLRLWDDWPEGLHPLLKDFEIGSMVPRKSVPYPYHQVEGEGVFEIPVGPVHAGIIEPGHFRFSVAGESIINLEIRLGYVHRGVEKLSETLSYKKGVRLAERISGDNGFAHSLAYCQCLEQIAQVAVPEKGLYLRTVFAELERMYNLFGDVAGIILDTGFTTGAQSAYQMREHVLQLNERLCGSRLLRSINTLGGVDQDIDRDQARKLNTKMVGLKLDLNDLLNMVGEMPSFLDRVETTGKLSFEAAKNLNVVGPVGRASGIDRDVRRDHPYAAYKHLSFNVPLRREGDVHARFRVKVEEILESISLIDQSLDQMPAGAIKEDVYTIPAERQDLALVESPRGELMHWLSTGDGRPFRHKVRDPSFFNWPALELAVLGNIVPDFPLINKSMNLSYAGDDL